jgi:hypothetical protein
VSDELGKIGTAMVSALLDGERQEEITWGAKAVVLSVVPKSRCGGSDVGEADWFFWGLAMLEGG